MVDAVTLPDRVALDAITGRLFQTSVTGLGSGFEHRNIDWPLGRFQAQIGLAAMSLEDARAVLDFFYARRGRARAFYWLDKVEYIGSNELLGTGDGSRVAFQIVRNHTSGAVTYAQAIKYLVSGSLSVTVNGTPTAAYTLSNGVITLNTPPPAGQLVRASFQYYIPVRFDVDFVGLQQMGAGNYRFPDLRIIEVIE